MMPVSGTMCMPSIPFAIVALAGGPPFTSAGAPAPIPVAPWHPAQPFCLNSTSPSFAVPCPAGSSFPVGLIEISHALISSAVGVRPTPYVGPWAEAMPTTRIAASGSTLNEFIVHAPIARDSPMLNRVVGTRYAEIVGQRLIEIFRGFRARGLHCAQIVRAARKNHALFSVPFPPQPKSHMGHLERRCPKISFLPGLALIGGYFHSPDRAAAGPRQAADFVKARPVELLSGRRIRDHRLRPNLIPQRRGLRVRIDVAVIVVGHVITIHNLDAAHILGLENPFETGNNQPQRKSLLRANRLAVHAPGHQAIILGFTQRHARRALNLLSALADDPRRAALHPAFLK